MCVMQFVPCSVEVTQKMDMDRDTVASSKVAAIGYDRPTQTLEVEFVKGSVYQYYGVPEDLYGKIMREPSKGRFLNTYIRDSYPHSRIG